MKMIIKNPAPTDWRQEMWGDFHFGRSLSKYLVRNKVEVETDYYPNWNNKKEADVVLVLRGKYPYKPKKNHFNVMWNISHPEDVTLEEYEEYDLIFVASNNHAEFLKTKLSKPVYPLLQCTDIEEFTINHDVSNNDRSDFIFVGNKKGVNRPGVVWSIEIGLPLKVWGRGWETLVQSELLMGHYIKNEELGKLYSKSKAILNDHYEDMKKYGFINNRVFDALACGLPVISDYHEELYNLFPNEILYYRNKEELESVLKQIIFMYPQIVDRVNKLVETIREKHTFEIRAKEIIDKINKIRI
ncbi:CgeB family protein [Bacillus sp. FJAT-45066]|uniref:CgeB family protein n=1 Tax=Bacillus sp. FJAT-45066 TaxID=2011010 RepID=UPI000BB78043|nr:glycosyltransferase [Bacillus sp. FJAT-45066]